MIQITINLNKQKPGGPHNIELCVKETSLDLFQKEKIYASLNMCLWKSYRRKCETSNSERLKSWSSLRTSSIDQIKSLCFWDCKVLENQVFAEMRLTTSTNESSSVVGYYGFNSREWEMSIQSPKCYKITFTMLLISRKKTLLTTPLDMVRWENYKTSLYSSFRTLLPTLKAK